MNLKDIAKRVIELMPELPGGGARSSTASPSRATSPTSSPPTSTSRSRRSRTSSRRSISRRACARCCSSSTRQLEILKLREKINSQVKEEMGRNQREYVLRQQLKAIKEELGEMDEAAGRSRRARGEDRRRPKMPPEVEKVAQKQLKRLQGHAAVVGRVHRRAHLPRLDRRPAVVDSDRGQPRHRRTRATSSTRTTTASRR